VLREPPEAGNLSLCVGEGEEGEGEGGGGGGITKTPG